MIFKRKIPPTAGLPMRWCDWLPAGRDLTGTVAELFRLPPLQLECSGTAALIVALKILSSMPDNQGRREVIIPAYSCPSVVLAVAYCGLKPRLCDITHNGFGFDHKCLETLVGPQTLVIIPTHLGGQVADVRFCVDLSRQHGAYVIEDAAQALGAAVGKGLTLYEGGLLTVRTANLRESLRRKHGEIVPSQWFFEIRRLIEFFAYTTVYRPRLLYWFYGKPKRNALAKGNLLKAAGDIFDIIYRCIRSAAYVQGATPTPQNICRIFSGKLVNRQ